MFCYFLHQTCLCAGCSRDRMSRARAASSSDCSASRILPVTDEPEDSSSDDSDGGPSVDERTAQSQRCAVRAPKRARASEQPHYSMPLASSAFNGSLPAPSSLYASDDSSTASHSALASAAHHESAAFVSASFHSSGLSSSLSCSSSTLSASAPLPSVSSTAVMNELLRELILDPSLVLAQLVRYPTALTAFQSALARLPAPTQVSPPVASAAAQISAVLSPMLESVARRRSDAAAPLLLSASTHSSSSSSSSAGQNNS